MNLQEQISRIKSMMGVINENVPQPGISSGQAISDEEKEGMEKHTEQLTVNELIDMLDHIPYYKEVLSDVLNNDYSWGVTKKVMEYANYLKDNPDSIYNLPPIVIVNGKLQDGAHRISALYLLQNHLDSDNPLWYDTKLNVEFYRNETLESNTQEMKEGELTEKCWPGYTQKGMKTMFGKRYPNCVKKKSKTLKEAKNSEEDFNVEKVINKIIPKKFTWFKKIEINHISYDEFFHKITIHGKLKVDEKWGEKRWREYHEYKPFPSNSGWEDENPVLLGEIVKKEELNDLNNELELIISSIGGYPIIDTIRSEYLRLYFV